MKWVPIVLQLRDRFSHIHFYINILPHTTHDILFGFLKKPCNKCPCLFSLASDLKALGFAHITCQLCASLGFHLGSKQAQLVWLSG